MAPITDETPPQPAAKPKLGDRLKALLAEHGPLALYIYFSIFGLVLAGFVLAIKTGFAVEGAAGTAGTWAAAYVATKVTQPLRIGATLLLTPIIGRLLRSRRGRRTP